MDILSIVLRIICRQLVGKFEMKNISICDKRDHGLGLDMIFIQTQIHGRSYVYLYVYVQVFTKQILVTVFLSINKVK